MTLTRVAADTFQDLHVSVTARNSNFFLTCINDSVCVSASFHLQILVFQCSMKF